MSLLASGAVMLENWAVSGSIAFESDAARALYPATNLLLPHRAKRWRVGWTGNAGENVSVTIDLGSAKLPTAFALVDCNLPGTGSVSLLGADSIDMISSPVGWTLPLQVATMSGVRLWYPTAGEVVLGTAGARRYWRITFDETTYGPYGWETDLEVGAVWLGAYSAIVPDSGATMQIIDPSGRVASYGGSDWIDPLPAYRGCDLSLQALSHSALYTLKAGIHAALKSHILLDLHAYSSNATIRDGGLLYGKFEPTGGVSSAISSVANSTMRLRMTEARK